MREWGEIEVHNAFDVIGRGLVFSTSIGAEAGDTVVWRGVTWRVKSAETIRNSKGDGGRVKSGLIVVGEAGSSSTLDATEVLEAKGDGKG
jgi:hypothetical protein